MEMRTFRNVAPGTKLGGESDRVLGREISAFNNHDVDLPTISDCICECATMMTVEQDYVIQIF